MVQAPGLSFPSGTAFSWSEGTSHFFKDPRLNNEELDNMLRESMALEMVSRGYRLVSSGQYSISYVAALEGSLSDEEISRRFGLNPGLPSQQTGQTYEKGTVVVDISDPTTKKSLWRSAMQGYVELDLPESVRQERVKRIVAMMFSGFPSGK
jgi:hypothetical protein